MKRISFAILDSSIESKCTRTEQKLYQTKIFKTFVSIVKR